MFMFIFEGLILFAPCRFQTLKIFVTMISKRSLFLYSMLSLMLITGCNHSYTNSSLSGGESR